MLREKSIGVRCVRSRDFFIVGIESREYVKEKKRPGPFERTARELLAMTERNFKVRITQSARSYVASDDDLPANLLPNPIEDARARLEHVAREMGLPLTREEAERFALLLWGLEGQ